MAYYKPSIKYSTEAEQIAWEELIVKVRKIGILTYTESQTTRKGQETKEETQNSLNIKLDGTTIQTKEQLIEACEVNTKHWEVSSFRVSTWQQKEDGGQLYAVKCTFTKKEDDTLSVFTERVEQGLYQYIEPRKFTHIPTDKNIAIINIYDAHLDKVTRLTETGSDTNIKQNCDQFRYAFDYLLTTIGKPERIIFPVGNDFFNTNDGKGTKKGTPQDTYMSHIDSFEIGLNLIRECIDKAAELGPVYVPIVAGNHAEELEYILGVALKAIYSKTTGVEIDNSRLSRKYLQYGKCMFMFQHGDKMKRKVKEIPSIMAQEEAKMWAETTQRYALFGDIHHEQTHELTGVTAMFLRSMSNSDKWHHDAGYVGAKRSSYAHIFSYDGKYNTTHTINF